MKRILLSLLALLLGLALYLAAALSGRLGVLETAGEVAAAPRPAEQVAAYDQVQAQAARRAGAPAAKQVLFGDLHVHTTFSMDAFLASLPIIQGEGAHPPADACDFARHCAALDFFSINDHAEGLTQAMWQETKRSIRQCNAAAGPADDPDLVAFLGWEWTQMSPDPASHYGHKNVVLRETADAEVPARPIAAAGSAYDAMRSGRNLPMLALGLRDFARRERYWDFLAFRNAIAKARTCEAGVPVRELPAGCSEVAATPRELFDKLDDWGQPALVIPHGNAWGNTTPARVEWEKQLANRQHDPSRQTLIEVYSGHGNSEEYRPWRHLEVAADGSVVCPAPRAGFTPECHRAGEIVRARCLAAALAEAECEARAATAREHYAAAGRGGPLTVPGEVAEDWLDAGQCSDCFEPAFQYRPGGSTQNALAVSGAGVPGAPDDPEHRFRFGFIASSDNHTARAASGYKEFRALGMTDTRGARGIAELRGLLPVDREVRPESLAVDPAAVPQIPGSDERLSSFYYTGGLVAVHAAGRSRAAIWDALLRKEVYGTSGPRILLWFDLVNGPGGAPAPMGSEVAMAKAPRFRVRALGSRVQLPGCPDAARAALSPRRLLSLCFNECHHPGDTRRRIERIEIVRIRPRLTREEDVASLIEDPWRSFACAPGEEVCSVEFEDAEFAAGARDHVYYVRALEEPSEQVNAANLRCERDAEGSCIATRPCRAGLADSGAEACLAPERARAWSSPIFVDRAAGD